MCFDFLSFGGFDLLDSKDKPTERAWLDSKNHTFLLHPIRILIKMFLSKDMPDRVDRHLRNILFPEKMRRWRFFFPLG